MIVFRHLYSLCCPPLSPHIIGSRSPTVVLTIKESVVQKPFSSGCDNVNSSKSANDCKSMTKPLNESKPILNWQTFGNFLIVTWHVLVSFSKLGYCLLTKRVSFWEVSPLHVNLKEQQAAKPLAQRPITCPFLLRHSFWQTKCETISDVLPHRPHKDKFLPLRYLHCRPCSGSES